MILTGCSLFCASGKQDGPITQAGELQNESKAISAKRCFDSGHRPHYQNRNNFDTQGHDLNRLGSSLLAALQKLTT